MRVDVDQYGRLARKSRYNQHQIQLKNEGAQVEACDGKFRNCSLL
jgi:hypothetical protein